MRNKNLVFAVVGVAISGCASQPDKPRSCFNDEPPIAPTGTAESKAVKFVESRIDDSCRPDGVECNLKLRRPANGQIEVVASRAMIAGDPPACTRIEGGFETCVFSTEGKYIRVVLGL